MTWSHRPTSTAGVWELCRDGVVVGGVSLLPEAGWRVDLLLDDVVHGLNNPVPLAERGFSGRGGELLERRRAKIRGEAGR